MADQLVTTAQVKTRIFPAGVTDTADDVLISELIDQVSDYIEQWTGRKLVPVSSTTYVFDTFSGYVLRIPIGIRTITSMGVNNLTNQPDAAGSYTTVTATDYLLRPKVQDMPQGWPFTEVWISRGTLAGTISAFGNIQNGATITGTFGFAAVPPEIQRVAIDAVVDLYESRKNGEGRVIGDSMGTLDVWKDFFGTIGRYRFQAIG